MAVLYRAPPDRASDGRFGRVAGQHAGKQPATGGRPSYRDPGAVRRAWPKLKARFAAAKGRLLELAAKIDPADILPTVDDYSRLTAARDLDPLRSAVGIPMYDAALVFSHAVAWAVTKAKKKLAGQSQSYAAEDVKAQLLDLFREFVAEAEDTYQYHYDPATKTGVAWGKYYIRGHQVTEAEYKAWAARQKPQKGERSSKAHTARTVNRLTGGRSAKASKPAADLKRSGNQHRVRPAALRQAQAKAREIIAAVPTPTAEEVAAAHERMDRLGADDYEMQIRGNSTDRASSRARLLADFGDGQTCPCVYCGLVLDDSTVTRDKILTARQGGRYRQNSLLPACLACNKRRSDTPIEKVKWQS